jgi:hypothetical protein
MQGSMDRKEWVAEFFTFYRNLGFLQTYADSSVTDLVTACESLNTDLLPGLTNVIDDIDDPGDLFEPYDIPTFYMSPADNLIIDLRLLGLLESERVWWRSRDLGSASETSLDYLATFSRWIGTSSGRVVVDNLQWRPGNPPAISFQLAGVDHKIEPTYTTVDYGHGKGPMLFPDPKCLNEVNRMVQPLGPRFECYERLTKKRGSVNYVPFNATAYVLFLESRQRDAIWQDRHWSIW